MPMKESADMNISDFNGGTSLIILLTSLEDNFGGRKSDVSDNELIQLVLRDRLRNW
jgi:hypothetical protein